MKKTKGNTRAKSGDRKQDAPAKTTVSAPQQTEPVKRKVGRPSKYSPAFCESVLELGEQGKSKAQIAKALGVSRMTLERWEDEYPEFRDSLKHARDLAQAWWEDKGQEGLTMGKAFNATLFVFQMKARFRDDYGDVRADPPWAGAGANNTAAADAPRPADQDHLTDLGARFAMHKPAAQTAPATEARH